MQKNKGFTLIELLVVVLIIGILASVAVPQYTKAVKKSKLANAISLIKPFADAEEVYYMANGKYTPSVEDLDVDFPAGGVKNDSDKGYVRYSNGVLDLLTNASYINDGNNAAVFFALNDGFTIAYFLQNSSYPNTWVCLDKNAEDFCKSLGGKAFPVEIPYRPDRAYYLPVK